MAKFEVIIGKDFQINSVVAPEKGAIEEASRAAGRITDAKTRRILAYCVLPCIAGALAIATWIDFLHNEAARDGWSWNAVNSVWSAAALPLGYVLAYFFSKKE